MSVVVIARFRVSDMNQVMETLEANAAMLAEVTEQAKGMGCLHHRFVAGDGELVVIDEWETPEQFQAFFEGNANVAKVAGESGAQGPPSVSVFPSIEAAGTF